GGGGGWFGKITGGAGSLLGVRAALGLAGKAGGLFRGAAHGVGMFGAEIPGLLDTEMWMPGAYNPRTHRRNAGWENFLSLGLANREPGWQPWSTVQHAQRVLHRGN